ncbi:hypothetical protein J4558_09615 [Leptolyngbya sp. 15MV]|jgi:Spy/CpxP family protein refolding chaperone|nr:hypothetical protein J4558_09615 [Leptolyngbya sp. 15MV]
MRWLPLLALAAALPAAANAPSPYAGMTDRPIRALSAEQQADLRAGRGMALALAAELNGWPGPMHVLELADGLRLSADQRRRTEALMAAMRTEAAALGERIIAEEAALDALFREPRVAPGDLSARTAQIAALNGALRALHLRTHLAQAELLTREQIEAYGRLRGYGSAATPGAHGRHRH